MKVILKNSNLVFAAKKQHVYGDNLFDSPITFTSGMLIFQKADAVSGAALEGNGSTSEDLASIVSKVFEVHAGDKFVYSGTVTRDSPRAVYLYSLPNGLSDGTNMTIAGNTVIPGAVALDLTNVDDKTANNVEITITQAMIDAANSKSPATVFGIRAWGLKSSNPILKKVTE